MSLSSAGACLRANGLLCARGGVTATFFANGLCIGAWAAAAIPEIKTLFGLSDARLSIVLLAAGVGGLTAMPVAGVLPPKIGGTGRSLRISGPLTAILLAALPQTHLLSPGIGFLVASAFLFGFVNILMDVPMNAHASIVETNWGSAVMSSFHRPFEERPAAWSSTEPHAHIRRRVGIEAFLVATSCRIDRTRSRIAVP